MLVFLFLIFTISGWCLSVPCVWFCVCACLWRALQVEALKKAVSHRDRFQKAVLLYGIRYFQKENQLDTSKTVSINKSGRYYLGSYSEG